MTISATYIGQSTVQVSTTYTAGNSYTTLTPFLTIAKTIADAITGTQPGSNGTLSSTPFTAASGITAQSSSGWTLLDSYWGNALQGYDSTGTGKYNYTDTNRARMYTQVFRSLNEDATTYKNIILEYDLKKSEINTYTCEYWDTAAVYNSATPTISANRAPTNLATTYQNCSPVNWNFDSCDLLIFVSPRWCILHSYICNEPNNWAGVVELQREDPTDTATRGVPCWGWVNSVCPSYVDGGGDINNGCSAGANIISLPRTINGGTGYLSGLGWTADYGMVTYPNRIQGMGAQSLLYWIGSAGFFYASNAWDQTRKLIMSIKPIHSYNPQSGTWYAAQENHGIMNGLKVLSPVGTNMQKIKVPVDANGNSSRTGTDRTHWLLNANARALLNSTGTNRWVVNPKVTKIDYAVGGSNMVSLGCLTGIWFYYFDTNYNQLKKLNTITGTVITLTNWNSSTWTVATHMKFDNERFLWIVCQNATAAVVCWDITSDTCLIVPSSSFSSNLPTCLEITGSHIYIAVYSGNTYLTYHVIDRPNPTAALPASLTVTTPAAVAFWTENATTVREMCIDNYETVYFAGTVATASNAKIYMQRFEPGTTTYATFIGFFTPYTPVANSWVGLHVQDTKTVYYNMAGNSATAVYHQVLTPSRDTSPASNNSGATSTITSFGSASNQLRLTYLKCQGMLLLSPNYNPITTTQSLPIYWWINGSINNGYLGSTNTADLAGASYFNVGAQAQAKWCDNSRLIIGTGSGIRVYGNFNGGTSAGGIGGTTSYYTVGQFAIPA